MKGINIYMLVEKIILNEENKNGIKFWLRCLNLEIY